MFVVLYSSPLSAVIFAVLLPFSLSFYIPDSDPLLDLSNQVREVHLYTDNHRSGRYLQMTSDGRVSGNEAQSLNSVMELKSVKPGSIVIKGRASSLFLCIDAEGRLWGQRHYVEVDCSFTELLLADGYTRFLSSHHGVPVSLASKHSTGQHAVPFTRFLPLRNSLAGQSVTEQPPNNEGYFNVDSDDLLGMGLNAVGSPQFSVEH